MGDVTSGVKIKNVLPGIGLTLVQVETAATVDTADTFTLTLADYGMSSFLGIFGVVHTTANEVVVTEAPTTAVASGVLTVTVGGSAQSDKIRSYLIWGK